MLVKEDGPLDIFVKIRSMSGIKYDEHSVPKSTNFISGILSCFWCCSIWVGFLIALLDTKNVVDLFRRTLALSAAAIMLNELLSNE
jgi:hypothetical protein